MTTEKIKELLGFDYSVNAQTLPLEHLSVEEWAFWIDHLGYRWQVQENTPWGIEISTSSKALPHTKANEARVVHSEKLATFRVRI